MRDQDILRRLERIERVLCKLIERSRDPYSYLLPVDLENALEEIQEEHKQEARAR